MKISVDGRAAPLDAALDRAAALLAAARYPLVAGLGADVAGVRAALALAERLRGAVDHMAGDALSRDLGVLAEAGLLFVTPGEARARADVVVLVGDLARRMDWLAAVFGPGPSPLRGKAPAREVIALGDDAAVAAIAGAGPVTTAKVPAAKLPALLSAVSARAGERKVDAGALGRTTAKAVEVAVERLKAARYGVLVWDAAGLDALSVELLAGLVKALNAATRFAALPYPGDDGAMGAALVGGWTTAFPPRLGFRAGTPRHDPWEFDAARLVASGEVDAAVWVSALSPTPPPWTKGPPLVALVQPGTKLPAGTPVVVEVATPGGAHDAVLYDARAGGLVAVAAAKADETAPSVAAVLAGILARLPADAAAATAAGEEKPAKNARAAVAGPARKAKQPAGESAAAATKTRQAAKARPTKRGGRP